jgi:ABC-type branched-subunit amino acid transport system ATPase component/branched-subunit amino acid ABC-type transport system permease component
MSTLLPFIITGLTSGAVYALGGVGLVLTYKTSRVFNFAFGAIATVGAFTFFALHVEHGMATVPAVLISMLGVGIVLGLIFEPLARALTATSLAMQVAATVGILVFVQAFYTLIYGSEAKQFPAFLPTDSVKIWSSYASVDQLITVGVAVVATAGLYIFFQRARAGVAMRGVVDDPALLDLAGTSPRRVRRLAWIISCIFATACGLLIAPRVSLSANTLTLLIVQAFGAAAFGAFRSLPLTFVGGIVIGLASSILAKYTSTSSEILQGIPPSVPFLTLFLVMLVIPRRWLAAPARIIPVRPAWSAPLPLQSVGGIVVVALLALVPALAESKLTAWTTALCYVILFLSLGLLVRTSGQVSLSHVSFMAIGAAAFSHLSTGAGFPWFLALLGAGVIAVPIGMLLAIPAIRLGGLFLALATLGFGIGLQQMFYSSDSVMFGTAGADMPRPSFGTGDTGFYFVVLAAAVVVSLLVVTITRTRMGRLLRAMADSPMALATHGTDVNVVRLAVFSISAFLAAIAGALYGQTFEIATGVLFDPITSLTFIALILIVVGGEPWYAIMAAIGLQIVPAYIGGDNVPYYLQMFFGASAVAVALVGLPKLPESVTNALDRVGGAAWEARRKRRDSGVPAEPTPKVEPATLEVRDLVVRFGGVVAVDGFSLTAETGTITGLIGPNGAGKTTTFNACSGLVRPSGGTIMFGGRDVTSMGSSRRARLGLGRTFQQMELFDGLTVAENVALGAEASLAGRNPIRHLFSREWERRRVAAAVEDALDLCGLRQIADRRAGSLSTGQRRLVELGRCLAGPFRLLLLDEPSSGLDREETIHFGEILEHVVAERNVGILLVEHDMSLVMRVCQYIHVLDFGEPIFDGTPADVAASPTVQGAYLGRSEALAGKED